MIHVSILGAQGQVGRALAARVRSEGIPHAALGHAECDITDRLAVKRVVGAANLIVNCAAYTRVDRAESEVEAAQRVNALGAKNVAAICAQAGIPLIHLSTDYVFDGTSGGPAREDDATRPLNVYGRSKLEGEIAVRECLQSHVILRTSWVFSAHGANFVKTILRLAAVQTELPIVDDQVGGPTAANGIAKAILDIAALAAKPGFAGWGTYHFSGVPTVSWCEFARVIVADGNVNVLPIAAKDYPRPARRLLNSVLDCSRILRVFGIKQPDWRPALGNVLDQLAAKVRRSP